MEEKIPIHVQGWNVASAFLSVMVANGSEVVPKMNQ